MIDATDFTEDPLYLPKDTKVFVVYDADNIEDTIQRDRIIDMYGMYGYECRVQRLLDVNTINNCDEELGFSSIQTSRRDLSVDEIRQWYTFVNILRKARVLQKHFIVTFTGYRLDGDIERTYLSQAITILANGNACLVSTTEAGRIVKQILSLNVLRNSVKQYLKNRARS
jgi:hypothetical protein